MIAELDRYHGIVLRQLLVGLGTSATVGVANMSGRVDAFCINGAAFQIKHSSKRLSPWRFTYMPENLEELTLLRGKHAKVWVFLVCGTDGVVGLSYDELFSIIHIDAGLPSWVRVSRDRNSMYRVGGAGSDLPRAKARGLDPFIADLGGLSVGFPN
jgi:hypothetical protein